MKRLFSCSLIVALCTACQTMSRPSSADLIANLINGELHCVVLLPSEKNKTLKVKARFPSSNEQTAILTLQRVGDEAPHELAVPVTADGMIDFKINGQDHLEIILAEQPRIGRVNGAFDEKSATPCVHLIQNSKTASFKPAACNASGTPAQGWYQAGRIIQHSRSCGNETLSCGSSPIPGWYVQQKIQRTLVKSEECSWVRDLPVCKSTSAGGKGWHIGDRLLAVDSSCSGKDIECGSSGTKEEGWYAFERSSPQLLLTESCLPNRNISHLAR